MVSIFKNIIKPQIIFKMTDFSISKKKKQRHDYIFTLRPSVTFSCRIFGTEYPTVEILEM